MSQKKQPATDAISHAFRESLSAQGQAALQAVESKRGYSLPYHRLFAAHCPTLLTRYDAFYEALTLDARELTPYERETVWATLLAAVQEVHGSIHLSRAREAGLSDADLARCVGLAAVTRGFPTLAFSADKWSAWTDSDATLSIYRAQFAHASGDLAPGLAHLAATAAMAGQRESTGMIEHLSATLKAGVSCAQATEALSYLLLPCGGNVLIDAVAAWEAAAEQNKLIAPY